MTIKTKASLQSYFQRGDRPTSAQFADLINTFINIPVAGSTVSTGVLEIKSTASTTSHTLGTFANGLLNINTTSQAQQWLAFSSASGAGGGAFGTSWLNAATTADGANLMGSYIASNVLVSSGDTLYTDGSGLQRLTIGTTGQSLMMLNSSAPSWQTNPGVGSAQTGTGSETSLAFTSIPSWVRRITMHITGVSTNGTSIPIIQIGDSGGYETSSYLGASGVQVDSTSFATTNFSDGFNIAGGTHAASVVFYGTVTLTRLDTTTWSADIAMGRSDAARIVMGGGAKTLSAALDRVRLTTQNGTDAFDSGTVNILYE